MPDCSLIQKSWSELTTNELYSFLKLRTDIFFLEQKIDEEELDDRDQEPSTRHLWIADDAGVAAYLRIIVDDQPEHLDARTLIGRVVVRPDRRGEGLAKRLIEEVLRSRAQEAILLHAQEYIAGLYGKYGFHAFGNVYSEAGLPHVMMYREATVTA